MSRMTFVVGVGVGYVLGARAGRERYELIVRTARRIREHPAVQSSAGVLQAQAGGALHSVRHSVRDRLGMPGRSSDAEPDRWRHDEPAAAGQRR